MKKKKIQIVIGVLMIFILSFMFALNKLNKDIEISTKNIVAVEEFIDTDKKLTFFGLDVIHFSAIKTTDNSYDIKITKSDIYNYIPFIFASGVTVVCTTTCGVIYYMLNKPKRKK